jgi:hypothetical protein
VLHQMLLQHLMHFLMQSAAQDILLGSTGADASRPAADTFSIAGAPPAQ